MKKLFFTSCILLLIVSRSTAQQQTIYEVSKDPKDSTVKILKGLINKYLISKDSSFSWYKSSHDSYTPDSSTVAVFAKANDSIIFVLFGGTWCDDSKYILPKFFKLQEASGIADMRVTFWGVDEQKNTFADIASRFNIVNVPTIIIVKNDKELGRVVEYGKTGHWDKELAAILAAN